MSEPEGTAADFAAMLAGAGSTPPADSSSPAEPMPEPEPSKQEADAAWARALFGPKPDQLAVTLGLVRPEPVHHEEPPHGEPPPDFDGGVREPAPGPTDPYADHNQFIAELLRNTPAGGGGQW